MEVKVDQELPSFQNALKISDAQWMLNENQYYKRNYDMHIITDELEKKLKYNMFNEKPIQGICWYNILANADY